MKEMETGPLERILAEEEELEPMVGFSTRVMRAVKEDASVKEPIPFPWVRFLPGFLLNLGLVLITATWVILADPGALSQPQMGSDWSSDPEIVGGIWALSALFGSGALVWLTLKWVSPRQISSF